MREAPTALSPSFGLPADGLAIGASIGKGATWTKPGLIVLSSSRDIFSNPAATDKLLPVVAADGSEVWLPVRLPLDNDGNDSFGGPARTDDHDANGG